MKDNNSTYFHVWCFVHVFCSTCLAEFQCDEDKQPVL